jgi:hypothetical protein
MFAFSNGAMWRWTYRDGSRQELPRIDFSQRNIGSICWMSVDQLVQQFGPSR